MSRYNNVEHAFGGTQRMLSVIESIYAAVGSPPCWNGVLRQIADLLDGQSIALFARASDTKTPDLLSISEMDPGAWQQFVQHYAAINPIMQRCEDLLDPGTTWFAHSVLSDAELERTEFYTDFFQPNDMHHSVGMRLQADTLPIANISCQRSKHAGAFDVGADTILQTLRPHLVRALSLHMHMGTVQAHTAGLQTALDAYGHAVIGLDACGRVAFCSTHAQTLLDTNSGIMLQGARLACQGYAKNHALQQLIASAIGLHHRTVQQKQRNKHAAQHGRPSSAAMGASGDAMLLPGIGSTCEVRLTVLPYRGTGPGSPMSLAALVLLSSSAEASPSRASTLTSLYGLTPTEARVADLLAAGLDIPDMAERLKLSKDSCRFYLKRLFAKTGTRRQVDLLRLILSLPGVCPSGQRQNPG